MLPAVASVGAENSWLGPNKLVKLTVKVIQLKAGAPLFKDQLHYIHLHVLGYFFLSSL